MVMPFLLPFLAEREPPAHSPPPTAKALSHKTLFISADHRLIHPSTGFSILADVQTLFTFLTHPSSSFSQTHLPLDNPLDTGRLAVSGESGGGYAALAAGLLPREMRPRVVMVQYGMGGDFLDDHWLAAKTGPSPWKGGEVGRGELAEFFPEDGRDLEEVSFDPIVIPVLKPQNEEDGKGGEGGGEKKPALVSSRRREMLGLFWREGTLVDYILGRPGISAELRKWPIEERMAHVPEELKPALVQGSLGAGFPPTVFLHGSKDLLVDVGESGRPYEKLKGVGVKVKMLLVEGGGHALLDPQNMPHLVAGAKEAQEEAWRFVAEELQLQG